MTDIRKAGKFVVLAAALACWMGVLGGLRGVAEAGVIASRLPDAAGRAEDLSKIQSFLESRIVVQKLIDYGVSPGVAIEKVGAMSTRDLHRLASLTDRAAAGEGDAGIGILVGVALLVILVIVFYKIFNKEVIIR